MPATTATAVEPNRPDPPKNGPNSGVDSPTHPSRLLTLVRALIDYGRQLANTLQQRTATTDLFEVTHNFGTINIAQILACITRGLQRAAELEARLLDRLAHLPAEPATHSAPVRHQHTTPREDHSDSPADTGIARLPTPAHIAAELRHRPIGAVLADICRDLGIIPSNPLWRELSLAIIANNGNLTKLLMDTMKRFTELLDNPPATEPPEESAPDASPPLPPATGPP